MTKDNIVNVTNEIVMQIRETEDEFIYERLIPYSEYILQQKISKEELKRILLLGIQKDNELKCKREVQNDE